MKYIHNVIILFALVFISTVSCAKIKNEVYSNAQIDQKILRPAKERIKESGSDVWFDYQLICKYPIKGRKPKADTVVFNINTLHPREEFTGGSVMQWITLQIINQ